MLKNIFRKKESLLSVDIGAGGIKLVELGDITAPRPKLLNIGYSPFSTEVFTQNVITKPEKVAEQLSALLEANEVQDRRIVTSMPGPSVFTKKIKMDKQPFNDLAANIQFEAGNFIPHSLDAVRLDFHIIGDAGKGQVEVLVVAVKNEVVDSFFETFNMAGLEIAVVDVDHFAMQNCFELSHPEEISKTVALINIGSRYSSINICRSGDSLFTGDIPVGGKLLTEALSSELGVTPEDAEMLKKGHIPPEIDRSLITEIVDKNVEYVATEFNRQLSFFWNASGADEGIEKIVLCGGGSVVPGLLEEIAEKTGIECGRVEPFKGLEIGETFDREYLLEIAPMMSVAVGMASREPGDRMNTDL